MSFIALGRSGIFFFGGGEEESHGFQEGTEGRSAVANRVRKGDYRKPTANVEELHGYYRLRGGGGKLGKLYRNKTNRLLELL